MKQKKRVGAAAVVLCTAVAAQADSGNGGGSFSLGRYSFQPPQVISISGTSGARLNLTGSGGTFVQSAPATISLHSPAIINTSNPAVFTVVTGTSSVGSGSIVSNRVNTSAGVLHLGPNSAIWPGNLGGSGILISSNSGTITGSVYQGNTSFDLAPDNTSMLGGSTSDAAAVPSLGEMTVTSGVVRLNYLNNTGTATFPVISYGGTIADSELPQLSAVQAFALFNGSFSGSIRNGNQEVKSGDELILSGSPTLSINPTITAGTLRISSGDVVISPEPGAAAATLAFSALLMRRTRASRD